jgi:hypothetical protein
MSPTETPGTAPSSSSSGPPDSIAVELENFTLEFTVTLEAMPLREDLAELEATTDAYLDEYMKTRYEKATAIDLILFSTELVTSSYATGEPIPVEFKTTAYFSKDSSDIPKDDVLQDVRDEAFLGDALQDYIDLLNELAVGNVFQTTESVELSGSSGSDNSKRASASLSTTGIVAGAVGLALLSAAFVLYKVRLEEDDSVQEKAFNKPIGGDITIAGDTYTGAETCDASSFAESRRYRSSDEEEGLVAVDLGISREAYDDSSVVPVWNADDNGELAGLVHQKSETKEDEQDERADRGSDDDDESGMFVIGEVEDEELTRDLDTKNGTSTMTVDGFSAVGNFTDMMAASMTADEEEDGAHSPDYYWEVNGAESRETAIDTHMNKDSESFEDNSKSPELVSPPQQEVESQLKPTSLDMPEDKKEPMFTLLASLSTNQENDATAARRPLTVAEIESLLSVDFDKNNQTKPIPKNIVECSSGASSVTHLSSSV